MPAIYTLNVCEHTSGQGSFYSDLVLEPVSPPDWLTWNLPFVSPPGWIYSFSVSDQAPGGNYIIHLGFGQTMVIYIEDCSVHVDVCLYDLYSSGPLPPPEGWEFWLYENSNSHSIGFIGAIQTIFALFDTPGTYWITLTASDSDPIVQLVYEFNVTACLVEDLECKSYPLMVVWLNQAGGFNSYIFNGKKTYGVDTGNSGAVKDSNRTARYSSINNIYDTVNQPTGYIREYDVDFLKGLKYSMQAWVVEGWGTVDIKWIPIFNYAKSFVLKKQSNGFYTADFDFWFADEVLTQS